MLKEQTANIPANIPDYTPANPMVQGTAAGKSTADVPSDVTLAASAGPALPSAVPASVSPSTPVAAFPRIAVHRNSCFTGLPGQTSPVVRLPLHIAADATTEGVSSMKAQQPLADVAWGPKHQSSPDAAACARIPALSKENVSQAGAGLSAKSGAALPPGLGHADVSADTGESSVHGGAWLLKAAMGNALAPSAAQTAPAQHFCRTPGAAVGTNARASQTNYTAAKAVVSSDTADTAACVDARATVPAGSDATSFGLSSVTSTEQLDALQHAGVHPARLQLVGHDIPHLTRSGGCQEFD